MKNRSEMEENQRSKYACSISFLNEKNCQEQLITFCGVSHPQRGTPKSAKDVSSPGSRPGYSRQTGSGLYAVT